jgi:hypothetical protein
MCSLTGVRRLRPGTKKAPDPHLCWSGGGVVGATGFEPVTSSVSAMTGEALCYPTFPQLANLRKRGSEAFTAGDHTQEQARGSRRAGLQLRSVR